MNNNELKIMVPNGWVVNEEVMADGGRMLVIKLNTTTADDTTCHLQEDIFKKVPASELSLEDDFLKYTPKTEQEKQFKRAVKKAIKAGVHDFWRPVCDPSFDDDGRICYEPGKMPAVGKKCEWWEKNAKNFCPERGSRLGTKYEYIAFLAVLIKELVASGKTLEWAWNAICNDSKELGHYRDSENAKEDFEPTGSREICGWCDLANSYKIVAKNKEGGGFWFVGGSYRDDNHYFYRYCLSALRSCNHYGRDNCISCGWLVLTEGSTDH